MKVIISNKPCYLKIYYNNITGIARYVGQQIIYTRLAEGFTHPTIKKAFDTLCMARVATKVPSASPSGLPLGATPT